MLPVLAVCDCCCFGCYHCCRRSLDEYARQRKRLQQGKLTEEQAVADAEKSLAEWDKMKEDITAVDVVLQRNRKHRGQLEEDLSLEVDDAKIRLVRSSSGL